jgi:hypothetical protein
MRREERGSPLGNSLTHPCGYAENRSLHWQSPQSPKHQEQHRVQKLPSIRQKQVVCTVISTYVQGYRFPVQISKTPCPCYKSPLFRPLGLELLPSGDGFRMHVTGSPRILLLLRTAIHSIRLSLGECSEVPFLGSRSDSKTSASHLERGRGRDGEVLRCRRCGSDGFGSKKDAAWRSGLGVGVSDSMASAVENRDVESTSGASALVGVMTLSIASKSASDTTDTDVAADSAFRGCDVSSLRSGSDSEYDMDRGGVIVLRS